MVMCIGTGAIPLVCVVRVSCLPGPPTKLPASNTHACPPAPLPPPSQARLAQSQRVQDMTASQARRQAEELQRAAARAEREARAAGGRVEQMGQQLVEVQVRLSRACSFACVCRLRAFQQPNTDNVSHPCCLRTCCLAAGRGGDSWRRVCRAAWTARRGASRGGGSQPGEAQGKGCCVWAAGGGCRKGPRLAHGLGSPRTAAHPPPGCLEMFPQMYTLPACALFGAGLGGNLVEAAGGQAVRRRGGGAVQARRRHTDCAGTGRRRLGGGASGGNRAGTAEAGQVASSCAAGGCRGGGGSPGAGTGAGACCRHGSLSLIVLEFMLGLHWRCKTNSMVASWLWLARERCSRGAQGRGQQSQRHRGRRLGFGKKGAGRRVQA